jgi:hypothetical protein
MSGNFSEHMSGGGSKFLKVSHAILISFRVVFLILGGNLVVTLFAWHLVNSSGKCLLGPIFPLQPWGGPEFVVVGILIFF